MGGCRSNPCAVTWRWDAWIPSVLLSYWVLLGGTALGETHPAIRFANSIVAVTLVVIWLRGAARHGDAIDIAVLGATLIFLATCVTSTFPRQSLDAGIAALGYASALAVGRRALVEETARRRLLVTMAVLSATLAGVTALRWLPALGTWFSIVGFQLPPLDLPFDARPWGHRHDLALLLVLLGAAWAPLMRDYRARTFAIAVWSITLILVVIDGSRAIWLALGVATIAVVGTRSFAQVSQLVRRRLIPISIALVAAIGAAWISGVLERVANVRTLTARGELWSSAFDAWTQHPVLGFGPGSFPWTLSATDYFDLNTWAPRHPDSAFFQLLPEAGLAGLISVSVLLLVIVPRLWRGNTAQWVVVCLLVACIGANPTDFGFMIGVLVAWTALGLPKLDVAGDRASGQNQADRGHSFPALLVLGVVTPVVLAVCAVAVAETEYVAARQAIERGAPEEALDHLVVASRLDPGMAIYQRASGIAAWSIAGRPEAAEPYLVMAVTGNPYDDLSWRTLASAQMAQGRPADAWASIQLALQLQRSDSANLLVAAQIDHALNRESDALALTAESLEAWPTLSLGTSWVPYLRGIGEGPELVMAEAIDRWRNLLDAPHSSPSSTVVLTALGHRHDLLPQAIEQSNEPRVLVEALAAAVSCEIVAADQLLDAATQHLRTRLYWALRYVVDQALQEPLGPDREILRIMGGAPEPADMQIAVLAENVVPGFSIDQWGYRRETFPASALGGWIPKPVALDIAFCH